METFKYPKIGEEKRIKINMTKEESKVDGVFGIDKDGYFFTVSEISNPDIKMKMYMNELREMLLKEVCTEMNWKPLELPGKVIHIKKDGDWSGV